jgi:pyruvate dehydrogenase E2 component (dihydrolipoamide acetyltransferase)
MAIDIIVPPLSQTMDSLVLVAWVKKVGDPVVKGETLYQVETDKATLEVESPATGILKEILAEPGAEVLVRSKIGAIAAPGEEVTASPGSQAGPTPMAALGNHHPASEGAPAPAAPAYEMEPVASPLTASSASTPAPVETRPLYTGPGADRLPPERLSRIFASPRARNLAQAEGVALDFIKATGPQSMIVERDVRDYLETQKTKPAARVTPLAKRMAEAAGVDLGSVAPVHPGTVIRRVDVEAAMQAAPQPQPAQASTPAGPQPVAVVTPTALPGKGRPVALTALRKTIARRMQESHLATAPVTLTREVDATGLVALRADILKELSASNPRPGYTDFLVAILGRVLLRHPNLNALFNGEVLEVYDDVHMGIAVDTDRGLVVPVIKSTTHKGLLELAGERIRLSQRALDGTLALDELVGGTFTLTNLGPLGVDGFTPIINPPQVAILGVGRIRPAPAVFEGQVSIRQVMVLSLTFDHRVVDGAPAARFLADVAQFVEKPQLIWL